MNRRFIGCLSLALALLPLCASFSNAQQAEAPEKKTYPTTIALPEHEPVKLELIAKLGKGPGRENSGIVKSRQQPDLFWIHNDSGDEPRVYAVHADGTDYAGSRASENPGTLIGGAINVDWEDIAVDDAGHLIVGDTGNNGNDRRDLVLYYLNEPSANATRTTVFKKVFFHYPEQKQFPAPKDDFNYDCEAMFTVDNVVHLISKNRSGTEGKLYRLEDPRPDVSNPLKLVETFDFQGKVVGADASPDGLRLIVITYESLWLFERASKDQSFFAGSISWAPYKTKQVEAVCFADDNTLLLADEAMGELYSCSLSQLHLLRAVRVAAKKP